MVTVLSTIEKLKFIVEPYITENGFNKLCNLGTSFFDVSYCLANGVFLQFKGSESNFQQIIVNIIIYEDNPDTQEGGLIEHVIHYGTYNYSDEVTFYKNDILIDKKLEYLLEYLLNEY